MTRKSGYRFSRGTNVGRRSAGSLCARHRRYAFAKKPAYLADESGPGRIARQENVVAALERDQPRPRNAAGDEPALGEWHGGVLAAMQDECRRDDARQKVEDIDVSTRLQQPGGILGRGRDALQVIERTHLFDRGMR